MDPFKRSFSMESCLIRESRSRNYGRSSTRAPSPSQGGPQCFEPSALRRANRRDAWSCLAQTRVGAKCVQYVITLAQFNILNNHIFTGHLCERYCQSREALPSAVFRSFNRRFQPSACQYQGLPCTRRKANHGEPC